MNNNQPENLHADFANIYEKMTYIDVQLYQNDNMQIDLDFSAVEMNANVL